MKFYKNLYIGETIKDAKKVKRKLATGAGQLGIYVITLCKGRDQLEIYHAAFLQQKYYRKNPPFIVGIANGYGEAVEIIQKIAEETYASNGSGDLKNYILDRT